MDMTKPGFVAMRAMSGISLMLTIGLWGCYSQDLNNVFLGGNPLPLIAILIGGIVMEALSMMMARGRPAKPSVIYFFGSTAIGVYLAMFLVASDNFMAQPPGGSDNSAWAPVIFIAYIGIVVQIYTMYRILKRETGTSGD